MAHAKTLLLYSTFIPINDNPELKFSKLLHVYLFLFDRCCFYYILAYKGFIHLLSTLKYDKMSTLPLGISRERADNSWIFLSAFSLAGDDSGIIDWT